MFSRLLITFTTCLSVLSMVAASPTPVSESANSETSSKAVSKFPSRSRTLKPRQSEGSTAQTYKIRSASDPTQYLGTSSYHEFVSIIFVEEKYSLDFTLPTTGQLEGVNIMTKFNNDAYLAFYSNGPVQKFDSLTLQTTPSAPSPNSFYTNAFTIPSTFPGPLTATYSPGTGTDPLQSVSFAESNGQVLYVTPADYKTDVVELTTVGLEIVANR